VLIFTLLEVSQIRLAKNILDYCSCSIQVKPWRNGLLKGLLERWLDEIIGFPFAFESDVVFYIVAKHDPDGAVMSNLRVNS